MKPAGSPAVRGTSAVQAESAFMDWVHRLVKGASELRALDAGEVDAIMDPATCSAVLLPAARTPMRVRDSRSSARPSRAFRNARASRNAAVARAGAANQLLAALPARDYARLLSGLEPVRLTSGDVLHEFGQSMQFIYFPTDSLISMLMVVDGRKTLGVALVGHEGVVGASAASGISASPVRALVQVSGMALRIRSARLQRELLRSAHLQPALMRFADALLLQVGQTAACNHFHLVQERLIRWLLMTRERLSSCGFRLTQEFLADMLGVRRVSVTLAASVLQRQKLIRYKRGNITILDQQGLEAACCSCYRHRQP